MAFLVEDGTGLAGANAFCDLEFARAHHDARGQLDTWDGDDVTTEITAADAGADTLAAAAHPFEDGDGPVRAVGDDLPDGMAAATDYWVVVSDADTIQLAASYDDAVADTPVVIDLADAGSGSMSLTHPDFDAQRAALVLATDRVETSGYGKWRGLRETSTQALSWPRTGARDDRGVVIEDVPSAVKRATAEYALRVRQGTTLLPDSDGSQHVTAKSESVGPISESVEYSTPTPLIPAFPAADGLLRAVTVSGARAYR